MSNRLISIAPLLSLAVIGGTSPTWSQMDSQSLSSAAREIEQDCSFPEDNELGPMQRLTIDEQTGWVTIQTERENIPEMSGPFVEVDATRQTETEVVLNLRGIGAWDIGDRFWQEWWTQEQERLQTCYESNEHADTCEEGLGYDLEKGFADGAESIVALTDSVVYVNYFLYCREGACITTQTAGGIEPAQNHDLVVIVCRRAWNGEIIEPPTNYQGFLDHFEALNR